MMRVMTKLTGVFAMSERAWKATAGVSMVSLKEGIDLSTAAGWLMANVLAAMANFERDCIRERTMLGLARARAQGKKLSRPRKNPLQTRGLTSSTGGPARNRTFLPTSLIVIQGCSAK